MGNLVTCSCNKHKTASSDVVGHTGLAAVPLPSETSDTAAAQLTKSSVEASDTVQDTAVSDKDLLTGPDAQIFSTEKRVNDSSRENVNKAASSGAATTSTISTATSQSQPIQEHTTAEYNTKKDIVRRHAQTDKDASNTTVCTEQVCTTVVYNGFPVNHTAQTVSCISAEACGVTNEQQDGLLEEHHDRHNVKELTDVGSTRRVLMSDAELVGDGVCMPLAATQYEVYKTHRETNELQDVKDMIDQNSSAVLGQQKDEENNVYRDNALFNHTRRNPGIGEMQTDGGMEEKDYLLDLEDYIIGGEGGGGIDYIDSERIKEHNNRINKESTTEERLPTSPSVSSSVRLLDTVLEEVLDLVPPSPASYTTNTKHCHRESGCSSSTTGCLDVPIQSTSGRSVPIQCLVQSQGSVQSLSSANAPSNLIANDSVVSDLSVNKGNLQLHTITAVQGETLPSPNMSEELRRAHLSYSDIDSAELFGELLVAKGSYRRTQNKCHPVTIGGSSQPRGRNSQHVGAGKEELKETIRCCDNLRCMTCDFEVLQLLDCRWRVSVDYLFLRNFYPNETQLRRRLEVAHGTVSYCCQCSWISVRDSQPLSCALVNRSSSPLATTSDAYDDEKTTSTTTTATTTTAYEQSMDSSSTAIPGCVWWKCFGH
eukprot:GHVQ01017893.1.p1 GENE.GHVQ01017893.1~~GHVQ01017893.1.p1  ORF type:complete len:653 (-),score=135.47 GHVQ01017893.1:373-2331(-)